MILDLQAPTLIFTLGLEGQVCFEFRLLDLACLVIPSRQPLFWERGIILLLIDAHGLSLLEEYCQVWVCRMACGYMVCLVFASCSWPSNVFCVRNRVFR